MTTQSERILSVLQENPSIPFKTLEQQAVGSTTVSLILPLNRGADHLVGNRQFIKIP